MSKSKTYEEFVEKFKHKKTTDDCYTPAPIYEAVADYVTEHYSLDRNNFIRPFWPGGDYENEDYRGKIVVDNPPFSILSKIRRFYFQNEIKYFLFAPALTIFSARIDDTAIFSGADFEFENGVKIAIAFCTNLEPGVLCPTDLDLKQRLIEAEEKMNGRKKKRPKNEYPKNVIYAANLNTLADRNVKFSVARKSARFIKGLEAQKKNKKAIFGSGFLISNKAVAEKEAAEKMEVKNVLELSEAEKKTIQELDAA